MGTKQLTVRIPLHVVALLERIRSKQTGIGLPSMNDVFCAALERGARALTETA